MRIWLVTIGEPVPLIKKFPGRLHRTGYLATFMADNGHKVVWWTSTFDHFQKKHISSQNSMHNIKENLKIYLLHGCGYEDNVSIGRIVDHKLIAYRFKILNAWQEKPDIILCSLPTLELCDESIRYGSKHGVPVVIDIRDLWPEVFLDIIPKPSRPAAKAILYPFYRLLGKVCSGATAITGVSEAYVEWGLKRGNRRRSNFDKSFPLGYPSQTVQDGLMDARVMNWKKKKVGTDEGTMIVCFFGTVGRQFDLDTLIGAARVLRSENISIQFVLCGSGDKFGHYKAITSNDSNIILPGWIDLLEIQSLMSISSIGLAPYKETNNFLCNYGNKTAEYLSAGLPIALSLEKGILHDLLIRQECGFSYGENPYYLANKLKDLFLHPEKLNRLSANAEQTYEEFFKAEIVYQKMMNYLSELANKYKTR